jgi:hypothetical protein
MRARMGAENVEGGLYREGVWVQEAKGREVRRQGSLA